VISDTIRKMPCLGRPLLFAGIGNATFFQSTKATYYDLIAYYGGNGYSLISVPESFIVKLKI
jgi:hypothetical protein